MNHKLEYVYKVRIDGSRFSQSTTPTNLQCKVGDVVLCQFDQENQSISIKRQATIEDAWLEVALTKSQLVKSEMQKRQIEYNLDDISNALKLEKASSNANSTVVAAFCDWKTLFEKDNRSSSSVRLIRSLSKLFLKTLDENKTLSEDEKEQLLIAALDKKDWLKAVGLMLSGADARQINDRGDTSLMISTKDKDYLLTEFLLAVGFSPFEENNQGVCAADIAKRRGDEKFLAMFQKFSSYAESYRHSCNSRQASGSLREQLTLLQTQNQDEGNRPSGPTTSESVTLADAQYLEDASSDNHDATRYWGQSFRDGGQFGSPCGMDDFGDESSP